jgi:RsiW-degrading membrane proteinase PrsW (M82 family)
LTGVVYGVVITFPIIQTETLVTAFIPVGGALSDAFFQSFAVAALVEEVFKFVLLFFLTWRNRNLNERFDGIVYSVFISLGFAGLENVLYVFNPDLGGYATALMRAFISVPGHAFFGVMMGYYFALAKFEPHLRTRHMIKALVVPYITHGLFDFFLLAGWRLASVCFAVLLVMMWVSGFRKMRVHLRDSVFRKD